MKRLFTFFTALFLCTQLFAQLCTPDLTYLDSTGVIFPLPYDSVTMTGGIDEPACINHQYEYVFQFVIPDTLSYSGIVTNFEYLILSAVNGLPQGINYSCNPPSCEFYSDSVEVACLLLSGTPTSNNTAPDVYPLDLEGQIKVALSPFAIPLSTALPLLTNGNTTYEIELRPEDMCVVATNELEGSVDMRLSPNPTTGDAQLRVASHLEGTFNLHTFDFTGKIVQQSTVQLQYGENTLQLDNSTLPQGLYTVVLSNAKGSISTKMQIVK